MVLLLLILLDLIELNWKAEQGGQHHRKLRFCSFWLLKLMVKSQVVKYWTKAKCIRTLCLLRKNADHPADNQEVLHKCAHSEVP